MAVLWFFGFASLFMQRVNLSIAIVSMVGDTTSFNNVSLFYNETSVVNVTSHFTSNTEVMTTKSEEDKCQKSPDVSSGVQSGSFQWDKKLQGLLLASFFWGYLCLQIPGGRLSDRFGAKKVVTVAVFTVSIFTIVSPFAARLDPFLLLAVRVLIGIGQSLVFPAAQAFWSAWSPPFERSRLIGFSFAGGSFGETIIFPTAGFLCAYGFDGGWPSVFYVIGTAGFVWSVFWCIFAHDSPAMVPRMSEVERKYLQYWVGERTKNKQKTPWGSIMTSKAVWAIITAHSCGNYGTYMLLTQLPTYMKDVLNLDITSNGMFSMLPYLICWVLIKVSSVVADLLISRKILSVAGTRKLMSVASLLGPGVMLIVGGHMDCTQKTAAIVLVSAAGGLTGTSYTGYLINHCDIAPRYAGTIFGISNTFATVPGIVAPYIVGVITSNRTRQEWLTTFYIAAAVYSFGALVYLILAQGEVQPWAEDQQNHLAIPEAEDRTEKDTEDALLGTNRC